MESLSDLHFERVHGDHPAYPVLRSIEQLPDAEARAAWIGRLEPIEASLLASLLQDECLSNCDLEAELRSTILRLLLDVCAISHEVPKSYWLTDVTRKRRIGAAGEATTYEGAYRGRAVVIREFHPPPGGDWDSADGSHILSLIIREVVLHRQLQHRNIAELIGFQRDPEYGTPAVVTVQAKYSSVLSYLQKNPGARNFANVVVGMCDGLVYLHSRSPAVVVHGNLHPRTIAVDELGNAMLCDFGYINVRHEITAAHELKPDVRLRYVPPELDLGYESSRNTTKSDIYSFGMVIYTLATLRPPFAEESDWAAAEAARSGARPSRPTNIGQPDYVISENLWSLITSMWHPDPVARPSAHEVRRRLADSISNVATHGSADENGSYIQRPLIHHLDVPASIFEATSTQLLLPSPFPVAHTTGDHRVHGYPTSSRDMERKGKLIIAGRTLSSYCSAEIPSPLLLEQLYNALNDPRAGPTDFAESRVTEMTCHLRAGPEPHRFILVHMQGIWLRLERAARVRSVHRPSDCQAIDTARLSYAREKLEASSDIVEMRCTFSSLQVYHLIECSTLAHDASPEHDWSPATCRWFAYVIFSTLTVYGTYQKEPPGDLLRNFPELSDVDATKRVEREFRSRWIDPGTHGLKEANTRLDVASARSLASSSSGHIFMYPQRLFYWALGWVVGAPSSSTPSGNVRAAGTSDDTSRSIPQTSDRSQTSSPKDGHREFRQ